MFNQVDYVYNAYNKRVLNLTIILMASIIRNYKRNKSMSDKKVLIKKLSDCRMILYDLQVFIKVGALASDSNIIDDNLQLNKSKDDYYIFFRTLNEKLQKATNIPQD